MSINKRPTSVSVIAWIFIVVGSMSLISNTVILAMNDPRTRELMELNPIPLYVQYVILFLGLVVLLTSGIGMLKGKNWARLLYVIWGAVGAVVGLATSPMKVVLIPSFIFYLVVVFFLFRPNANRYFN